MKCNANFRTNYAMVDGKEVHIRDYNDGHGVPVCIVHGHELIAVQGEYNRHHFRHKHSCDVSTSPLSEWHAEWQSHFKYTEVNFPLCEGQIKSRRADIVIGDFVLDVQYTDKPESGTVVEIQHSPITKEEVIHRNHDYGLHNKKVLWIIDGQDVRIKNNIVEFEKEIWKFDSFVSTPVVYIDIQGILYSFCPTEVKSCCVHVSEGIHKPDFIQKLNDNCNIFHVPRPQNKLYIKQQGAGNGKTWGIIQMLARPEFSHYTRFIYVTKQHSARAIIYTEFLSQQHSLGMTNVIEEDSPKKYMIQYTNASGTDCSIVISTIDSFMYALGDKQVKSRNFFEEIVRTIYETQIMDTTIKKNGQISYANQPKLNARTLYIVDETQDLHETYADALYAIMNHTNMDVYVVGDKLQSIHFEENAFTKLMSKKNAIQETPINRCRRFIHPKLVDFVNEIIPFERFQLLPITPWTKYTGKEYEPLELFPIIKDESKLKPDIEQCVQSFMWRFEKEAIEHFRSPEDFLIVTPWVNTADSAKFINHLDLKIQEFWVNQLQQKEFTSKLTSYWHTHNVNAFTNYSVLHRTEEGTCINLDDSKHATRIVSIHASKGDGRNVVFLIDPSLFKLSAFSLKNSLKLYSTLHVALTRMKEKLYIMHDDDEIGKSLKNACSKTNCPFMTDTLHISSSTRYKEISTFVTPDSKLFETQKDVNYVDDSDTTQIIDSSHHNIRYWVMLMKTYDILKDGDQLAQIATIVNYAMGNRTCVPWKTWKDYNEDLKKNNMVRCKDDSCPCRREEGEHCFHHMKNPKKYDRHIPLLELNTCDHRRYVNILEQTMKRIKYNFTAQTPLCPFELIVQLYMVQTTDRGQRSIITMNELYNVIDIYSKSFQHYMKGHANCLCTKLFPHNEHKNTLGNYLYSHYEKIDAYEQSVYQLKATYGLLGWNVHHRVCTEGRHFNINTELDLIGYTNTTVVIVYIKPNLTNLNFNELKYKAVMDKFIVQHCSDKDDARYKNKNVVSCVLALNQMNPYVLPLEDVPDMKLHVGSLLQQKYERKHVEVKAFYDYWMKTHGSIDKVVLEYIKQEEEYWSEHSCQKNASYITSVFDYLQTHYETCKDDSDEVDAFTTQLSNGKLLKLLQTKLISCLKADGFVLE